MPDTHPDRSQAGRLAYEEDVRRQPRYHTGQPRKTWEQLGEVERWSWERDPRPREWKGNAWPSMLRPDELLSAADSVSEKHPDVAAFLRDLAARPHDVRFERCRSSTEGEPLVPSGPQYPWF